MRSTHAGRRTTPRIAMKIGSIWLKSSISRRIRIRISFVRIRVRRSLLKNSQRMGASLSGSFTESPTLFHTNGGRGRVGKLEVSYHQNMVLGEVYPEIGFITQSALANGGAEIENTGSEPLVLTFDFPQNAHSHTPGVSVRD